MPKIIESLPKGRVDLRCLDCQTIYEYLNHTWSVDDAQPPRCPACESERWQRVYISMPYLRVAMWQPSVDPYHKSVGESRQFTESEYKAMAISHSLSTGEDVDWREIKKEVERKIY